MNLKIEYELEDAPFALGSFHIAPKLCFAHAVEVAATGHPVAGYAVPADDVEPCWLCGSTMLRTADDVFRVTPTAVRAVLLGLPPSAGESLVEKA